MPVHLAKRYGQSHTCCRTRGVLAQLVERNVRNVEVRGSTPLCSTKIRHTPDFLVYGRRGTAMKKGICRGHYPLYAHQNSVLMVDTWMCSEILCVACNTRSAIRGTSSPTRIRNYWGPQCKALNFVHNPERSEDLIKRGAFIKSNQQRKKIQLCVNL